MESEEMTIARKSREREESRARNLKCKNEGCDNSRAYGSSRCGECSAKHRATQTA